MKFTIYSKNGCPYCDKIKQVMELANLDHIVYTLDFDFTREDFYEKFEWGATFPQVILDEEMDNETKLGGCTDTVKYLQEQKLV